MFYILVNKTSFYPQYLTNKTNSAPLVRGAWRFGQSVLMVFVAIGLYLVREGKEGTYLGLIMVWACPFALLTWSFSGLFIVKLPPAKTAVPILLPTIYFWLVDDLALGRGTWIIESGTKLGVYLFGSLEIEEAIFFLATNCLIVFGLIAFDRGHAVVDAFPHLFPGAPETPLVPLVLEASSLVPTTTTCLA